MRRLGDCVRYRFRNDHGLMESVFGIVTQIVPPGHKPRSGDYSPAKAIMKRESYVIRVGQQLLWPPPSKLLLVGQVKTVLEFKGERHEMKTVNARARRKAGPPGGTMAGDSLKGAAVPKKPKQLTRKELATPEGRFAAHFQALLNERGWTKERFCERSGIKDATVRKWLRAASVPEDFDTLTAIAKALDVPGHPFTDYRMVLPPLPRR